MFETKEILKKFFNPTILKQNLIIASLFIAVFDNFKTSIINRVKYFYFSGIKNGVEQFDEYEQAVLNKVKAKNNKQVKATLLWLKEMEFITEAEENLFIQLTNMRNKLAHEMNKMLIDGFPENINELYAKMISLFNKIEKRWIIEIEIPINPPNIPYDDIDWNGITSMNIEFTKIMTDIAFTGNEEYLNLINNYSNNV